MTSLSSRNIETNHGEVESKDDREPSRDVGTNVSWSEFTQNTSIHGIAYVFNRNYSMWRR